MNPTELRRYGQALIVLLIVAVFTAALLLHFGVTYADVEWL